MTRRVLILCTGNSCRSQMAEYIWRAMGRGAWQACSAGSAPAGYVHKGALAALAEIGLDAHDARSKPVEEFSKHAFDLVVTVCNNAHEACPVFPGAVQQFHWPFDDPADATGSDAQVHAVFQRVRDEIRDRIQDYLDGERVQEIARFREWTTGALDLYPGTIPAERRQSYDRLIDATADALTVAHDNDEDSVFRLIPGLVRDHFAECGWEWNGVYAYRAGVLQLVTAAGPPVCATLAREGGVGTSGMCHDALLTGQAIVASNVKEWPGYVSCDGESGLGTVAGMAIPLRDGGGQPVAVWDLDSTQAIGAEDAFFMERYLASLGPFQPWPAMFR